jgi:uncharacterized Zn finger protein
VTDDPAARPRLLSATLFCENCGRETAHRVLRVDHGGVAADRAVGGVARCRECRLTHRFEAPAEDRVTVSLVVSAGPTSDRHTIELPRWRRVQVGTGLAGSEEPLTVRRIEGLGGASPSSAFAGEARTIWATRDEGAVVPVSIVDGRRTRSVRLPLPHGTLLRVGEDLDLGEERVEIVGLRARGHTWRRPGDEFSADEVTRVYGRRTSIPPAGRSPWRRERGRPSSRASVTSTASRSRSGPGTRTARTVPRVRTAEGGAAVQSDSPS